MKKLLITSLICLTSTFIYAGHGSLGSFIVGALVGGTVTSMTPPHTTVYVTPSTSTYTTYEYETKLVPVYDTNGNVVRYQETQVKVPKTVTVSTPIVTTTPTVVPPPPPPLRYTPAPPPPHFHHTPPSPPRHHSGPPPPRHGKPGLGR